MVRLSRLYVRLGLALLLLSRTALSHAQSMMLRNNQSPGAAAAINHGDFNNDGLLDLVTANVTGSVSVYTGRADGTFATPINTSIGHQPIDLAFGDFNNDGNLDVALAYVDASLVQVLLGNGDGTFKTPFNIATDAVPASVTASDFNHDGKMDLAIAIGTETNSGVVTNKIEILEGDGQGHFSLATTLGLGGTTSLVRKVRVGDFNADGKVDLAVLQLQAVSVWFGKGNFTFEQVALNQYDQATDLNTGDVNQDGFTDLLVSFTTSTSRGGGVDGYFGAASQAFTRRNLIAPSDSFEVPGGTIATDVNGDGINDLVAVDDDNTAADGVYIWTGNPDGSFQQTPIKFVFTTDRTSAVLTAGDFNRDGKIDFAAPNTGNGTLEVLLNATPKAPCQENTADQSITVCQPQDFTFARPVLEITAEGNSSNGVTAINVYIDNALQRVISGTAMDEFFKLTLGNHFVVVKGFDSTGASFRSDRHVTVFSDAPGETCATGNTQLTITACLPEQDAFLASPVQIFANAYSPRPLTAIQVYIDNQLVFNDPTASEVNKLFSLRPGSHFIVVKAWDANGQAVSDSRTINVQ